MAYQRIKNFAESVFKIKIFRNTLPWGNDFKNDLDRQLQDLNFEVVFDVGANIGQTALRFREIFPNAQIHAFEPVSKTFSLLQKNVSDFSNVKSYNLAFGHTKAILPIKLKIDSRINSLIDNRDNSTGEELVNVETISGFVKQYNIQKINYLKIDTEGFDLNVLKGAENLLQEQSIDFIQVEVGFHQNQVHVNIEDIICYLLPFNYALFGIYEQQPCWSGEPWIHFANAVFVRKSILGNIS